MGRHGFLAKGKITKYSAGVGNATNLIAEESSIEIEGLVVSYSKFKFLDVEISDNQITSRVHINFSKEPDLEQFTYNEGLDICIGEIEITGSSDGIIHSNIRLILNDEEIGKFNFLSHVEFEVEPIFLDSLSNEELKIEWKEKKLFYLPIRSVCFNYDKNT